MFRASVNETCLQSCVPDYPVNLVQSARNSGGNDFNNLSTAAGNEIFSVPPREGKHPVHFMQDNTVKSLLFLCYFQEENLVIRLKEK